ncbi:MAG: SDR family NAD(P)-dependent oxidoreductase [Acidobacteria bacterium]|nr:SDR family NAD(P)-dependent oxidoreductase [Acidobacteriota bacterium]
MFELTDRIAVVTGAAGNLGRAVAKLFVSAGARVVFVDRSQQRLEEKCGDLAADGGHLLAGDVDLTDEASVAALFDRIDAAYGRLDILVNTVGGFRGGDAVAASDPADWDFLFRINVRPTLLMCREAVPRMARQGRGRIINVGSEAALRGAANIAAYSASKAAVVRLTEGLAAEGKADGVTANSVLPGTMDTPVNRQAMPDADFTKWVRLEQVAAAILFLASDAAGGVTGASLPVTGKG